MAAPLTNFQAGGEDLSDIYVDRTTVTTDGEALFPESAFSDEGIAVVFNKSAWSWGYGGLGTLGLSTTIPRSSPIQIGSLTNWKLVATGPYSGVTDESRFSAAIKTDGTLWTWGIGTFGRLGLNVNTPRSSPTQVGSLTDWKFVGIGRRNSFAIKSNGALWAWGYNTANGVLGLNNLIAQSSPIQVGTLTDWSYITTAESRCFAIKTDGTLWSWGNNTAGRLGQNDTITRSSPVQIGASNGWKTLSTGFDHTHAIRNDGTLWGWGQPLIGRLGLNNSIPLRSSPIQVGTDTNWSNVSAGDRHTIAVRNNGTLWSWGYANSGQLGLNATSAAGVGVSSPTQVGTLTDWKVASAGYRFCAAIKSDGTLWSWGEAVNGKLGLNTTTNSNRSSPVQVGTATNWKSISSRNSHVIARRA